jgi:flavin reductase (DIM6/NTAB) family NADH-FMN oxidoreductase RutF
VDKKAKKKVLQMIPYGAYVVGTKADGGQDHFMFGTWLMQTSFKPPLVAFAFLQTSRTLANVRRSKVFTVSFLRKGMEDLAQHVLDEAFEKVKTERSPSGLPVVSGGAGWVECRFVDILEQGDHPVVLAEAVDFGAGEGAPLLLDALGWHYGG